MYQLEDRKDPDGTQRQVIWILDDAGNRIPDSAFSNKNFRVEFVPKGKKEKLAVMIIRHPKAKYTILFSHGNATDIGCMRDHLIDMAIQLEVNIWCYDYMGYGLSTGKPTAKNVMSDIETVYKYMTTTGGISPSTIILYGQSLGSGTTVHLGKQHRVLGVILHSGMMSGLRVIKEVKSTKWFDIFPNIDGVKLVQSPLFVIHGQQDEEIPCHHGVNLSDNAKIRYEPWFVDGAGHNNIEIMHRHEFFERLKAFLSYLDKAGVQQEAPRT